MKANTRLSWATSRLCATRAPSGAVLTLAAALAVTLLLYPVWSWLERTTGIESVGHSGPAGWCYLAVWAPMAAALLLPPLWRLVLALWRGVEGLANTPH